MAKTHRSSASQHTNNTSSRVLDDILALAGTLLRSRKDYGADKLNSLAQATREYANSLSDAPSLHSYVASASENIDELADYVMHTEIDQIIQDAGNFARRHPIATLGVTIGVGLLAGNMMRGSRSTSTAANSRRASSSSRTSRSNVRSTSRRSAPKRARKQSARTTGVSNGSVQSNA